MPDTQSDPRAEYHLQVRTSLWSKRAHFDAQWEEVARRIIPAHKESFYSRGMTNALTPGRKNQQDAFDASATLAAMRFTSIVESLATPQKSQWHMLKPQDPGLEDHRPTRLYLDELTKTLFRYRYSASANFVGQSQRVYLGYGVYGNGLMFVDKPSRGQGLRYNSLHLGETYLIENDEGMINGMYRTYWRSPQQMVEAFGPEVLPREALNQLGQPGARHNAEREILHVVHPRMDFIPGRIDTLGLPYESLHFDVQTQTLLRESGYRTFPLSVARYLQFTNETYGRGPAQLVLPSIKGLGEQKKAIIRQGHRVLDPVLLTHDDGMLSTFSLRPGQINAGGVTPDGRPLVHVLPTGNLAVGKDMMDEERAAINDAFWITIFQILIETPQMTATEVLERAREKGILVGPTIGRLEAEYLGTQIGRELDVLGAQGLLPEPPEELAEAGGGYEIDYDNPMSRMVEAAEAAGFMRALDKTLEVVQVTQDPSHLDWFNFDVAIPAIQRISGAPTAWTRTLEGVQAIRGRREQERQDQKAIQAAPSIAALEKARQARG